MNNPHIHNPGTGDSRTPSNTTGFIYGTYSAAGREDHIDKAFTKAYLSSAVGGSVSTISFEDKEIRNQVHIRHSGIRGRIRGFSKVSRRNLLRRLASINRTAFNAFKGRLISITLTYPSVYPEDPEVCKRHLDAFHKRLQRRYGKFALPSGGWASKREAPSTSTCSCSCRCLSVP